MSSLVIINHPIIGVPNFDPYPIQLDGGLEHTSFFFPKSWDDDPI